MAAPPKPARREDFRVAIICALPREAAAMTLLFDTFWDQHGDPYGKAPGDSHVYRTGRIGRTDVVLVTLKGMGTNCSARACASLRHSFRGIGFALIVGICGGVPTVSGRDIFLGDVVISSSIVQYDRGRQYDGRFAVTRVQQDTLGRAGENVRSIIADVKTDHMREMLGKQAGQHLQQLEMTALRERREVQYTFPGAQRDVLHPAGYVHRHRQRCTQCSAGISCQAARKASCAELGCDPAQRVARSRRAGASTRGSAVYEPDIIVGRVGSGNTVMKSGVDRDRLAAAMGLVAFEMEGAGAWDEVPCLVVKSVCDYADSHKNKAWQDFSAAVAASVARAIIENYAVDDLWRIPKVPMTQSLSGLAMSGRSRYHGQRQCGQTAG